MTNKSPYTKSGKSWREESLKKKDELKAKEKAKIFSSTAKARLYKTKTLKVKRPSGKLSTMKSSWVKNYSYNKLNKILYMATFKGSRYYWNNVNEDDASSTIFGKASCITNDPRKLPRWWIGKNPSLGAAYWHIMLKKYGEPKKV